MCITHNRTQNVPIGGWQTLSFIESQDKNVALIYNNW